MKATADHATPWATRPAAPAPPSRLEKHTAGWGRREGLRLGAAAASSLCRCCRPRWPTQHCLHVALVTALMLPGCAAGRGVRGLAEARGSNTGRASGRAIAVDTERVVGARVGELRCRCRLRGECQSLHEAALASRPDRAGPREPWAGANCLRRAGGGGQAPQLRVSRRGRRGLCAGRLPHLGLRGGCLAAGVDVLHLAVVEQDGTVMQPFSLRRWWPASGRPTELPSRAAAHSEVGRVGALRSSPPCPAFRRRAEPTLHAT